MGVHANRCDNTTSSMRVRCQTDLCVMILYNIDAVDPDDEDDCDDDGDHDGEINAKSM